MVSIVPDGPGWSWIVPRDFGDLVERGGLQWSPVVPVVLGGP